MPGPATALEVSCPLQRAATPVVSGRRCAACRSRAALDAARGLVTIRLDGGPGVERAFDRSLI